MKSKTHNIPSDKTQYSIGDNAEGGFKIEMILGFSPKAIVYCTSGYTIRWEISDENPPKHYKQAVEEFDKIYSLINASVLFKNTKINLTYDLGNALFNAINSDDVDKSISNFVEFTKRLRAQINFHSKLLYVLSSVFFSSFILFITYMIHIRFLINESIFGSLISNNVHLIILGIGSGTIGALVSVLISVRELIIPENSSPLEQFFWGSTRILLGATSGGILIILIKGGFILDIAQNELYTMLAFSIFAGFSERYIGKQLSNLAKNS